MSMIKRNQVRVKPTRNAPRPNRPFGLGIFHLADCTCNACLDESAARHKADSLSDEEQQVLDELQGDWPPADADLDAESDPSEWADWTDAYRFIPSAEDDRWAAETSPFAGERYDVAPRVRDVVRASMIHPAVAEGLATGLISLF